MGKLYSIHHCVEINLIYFSFFPEIKYISIFNEISVILLSLKSYVYNNELLNVLVMTMFEAEWTKQENGKNQKKSSLIGMYFYSRAKHF